jgi:putative spermidine/putrescine transport system permease protein
MDENGIERRPEDDRIYVLLFVRTLIMSLAITTTCILLGYPIAYLLASLPARSANLLMILVLLPFWTSLLVRTSAWKVLLQQQGVINDILVWAGIVGEGSRLVMINNQAGTIIAMTHILLPFMILPLYSVMKGIPPSYVRAAKSLGANDWTAFWRVYFPQSVPGIGAGSILVFILAIGYYITPELVGGPRACSSRTASPTTSSIAQMGAGGGAGTILLIVVLCSTGSMTARGHRQREAGGLSQALPPTRLPQRVCTTASETFAGLICFLHDRADPSESSR